MSTVTVDIELFEWMVANLMMQATISGAAQRTKAQELLSEAKKYDAEFLLVRIVSHANEKIPSIKVIRALAGLDLKSAKKTVDDELWFKTSYAKIEAYTVDLKDLHDNGCRIFYERITK